MIDDIFKQTTPIKLTSPSKPRLKGKPNYLGPEQMNWFYIIMFIIEGFGSQTLGFMSTYYAAECGYLGWSQVENVQDRVVPQVENLEYEDIIYSTTDILRGVDPLSQNCIETGYDYYKASLNYGKAI